MNAASDLLELFDKPAWVVDWDSRLLAVNRAGEALLVMGRPVAVSAGRVRCEQARDQRAMTTAHRQISHGTITRRHVGLFTHGRAIPIVLTVARLMDTKELFGPRGVGDSSDDADVILTVVHDLQSSRVASSDVVAEILSLTKAEARVATQLAEGKSATDIALQSGVSLHTVRTHLRSIFGKTGTVRQSDIVRLVSGIPCATPQ